MLKNYFKIAIAVLKRRKFFTFISLFGISFTLTILIVLTAFIDHLVKPAYPDFNRDRELFVNRMRFESSKAGWMNQSNPSFYFFTNYVAKLKTPFKMALYTGAQPTNAYQNNKKIAVDLKYTNVTFWEVFRYEFVEGKAYNTRQVTNADKVAVITTDARTKYFGEGIPALGKYIEANNTQYRVIGVVKPAPSLSLYCSSDVYLPYTLSKINLKDRSLMGGFSATLLAEKEEDLPLIKNEFELMVKKLPSPDKEMDIVSSHAESYVESFTQRFLNKNNSKSRYVLMLGASIFLFMLLPTINLVNINVSRIMERSSEIGVRKAFGASSTTLAYQFIVENLILTLFGGFLGLIFSLIAITVLNSSGLVPNLDLQLNLTVLAYSLCACLVFGLFSGVYPAWRMSKLDVVTALKANN